MIDSPSLPGVVLTSSLHSPPGGRGVGHMTSLHCGKLTHLGVEERDGVELGPRKPAAEVQSWEGKGREHKARDRVGVEG